MTIFECSFKEDFSEFKSYNEINNSHCKDVKDFALVHANSNMNNLDNSVSVFVRRTDKKWIMQFLINIVDGKAVFQSASVVTH